MEFFYRNTSIFSTRKLHDLDEYWTNNRFHPIHQQIHEIIEIHLIQRGEKTLKQKRLSQIRRLERSYLISNPMGRLSANIISLATKLFVAKKLS